MKKSSKYRSILKEGNILIFEIDIIRNNSDTRYIIKTASLLNEHFSEFDLKLSIYSSVENIINYKKMKF